MLPPLIKILDKFIIIQASNIFCNQKRLSFRLNPCLVSISSYENKVFAISEK